MLIIVLDVSRIKRCSTLEGVGSGAVSNQVSDVSEAGLVIIIGSNPTENHPVAATWMKNAAKNGTKIVLIDPRMTSIASYAWKSLKFKPGSDVSLFKCNDPCDY